ncbi:N-acyl homoserine lactone hydrolase [Microdochium nivale]|nr:N-acyl homoserine lactone hydrolase [Microdochium nivale]
MDSSRPSLPPLGIPESQSIVQIYIIDTTSFMSGFPASSFVEPLVPGWDTMNCKSYSYLIRHGEPGSKYHTVLFDLGVRKDWENSPPGFVGPIKENGFGIKVDTDVASILRDNGEDLSQVGAIIWSHWHFDHSGDPTTFPPTTDLIVGPGFRSNVMPGYPTNKDSHVDERAWQGRALHEVDFGSGSLGDSAADPSRTLRIGKFQAYDFYGDGSFYLLNSPGHAVGHISALARTTADPPSYVILGGDIAHHCGQFRPSPWHPLPETIAPSRGGAPRLAACPGRLFLAIHPRKDPEKPFFDPVTDEGWHDDAVVAKDSIAKLAEADAYDNIFLVMAHDMTLGGVIDLYPKPANAWMVKHWKEQTLWGFLDSFTPAVEKTVASPQPHKVEMIPTVSHEEVLHEPRLP